MSNSIAFIKLQSYENITDLQKDQATLYANKQALYIGFGGVCVHFATKYSLIKLLKLKHLIHDQPFLINQNHS